MLSKCTLDNIIERIVDVAVDAIVVSPTDVERYKESHALVIKPALKQGTVVYESP